MPVPNEKSIRRPINDSYWGYRMRSRCRPARRVDRFHQLAAYHNDELTRGQVWTSEQLRSDNTQTPPKTGHRQGPEDEARHHTCSVCKTSIPGSIRAAPPNLH